jgi:predicted dehydrogenase
LTANGRIRVGIVGAGENTQTRHIPNLQAIEGVELVGVANRSRESSEAVVREFGIGRAYDTWLELVTDPDVDAVVIGTWPNMHCPVTVAALEADKHVLCEARMAMNAAEAHVMHDAARCRPHLVAQLVPSPLTLRVDRKVQALIAEGYLGELLAVDARVGGGFVDRDAPLAWRHDMERSGFNTMFLGVLYECLMRWVGHATRVTAMGRTVVKTRRDDGGVLRAVHIPDHLDVVADLASGGQAHLLATEITGLRTGPEIYVFGSEGTLRFAAGELEGGRRGDAELGRIELAAGEEGGWRVELDFVEAIRGERAVELTRFEDGVKYMEFTEAVARSRAEHRAVPLPL